MEHGNDFVRSISKYKSLRKIIKKSIDLKSSKCDLILVNKKYYSINLLSVGFDSLVGKNVNKFRWIPFVSGSFKYNLSIFYTLLQNKNFKLKIRIDNEKIYKNLYTLVAISNGKYYGGGICPNKDANTKDGILDICIIDKTSVITKLKLLPKYKKGLHSDLKEAYFEKCKESINIVSNHEFPISIDGEIIYSNKLNCKLLKNQINIVYID